MGKVLENSVDPTKPQRVYNRSDSLDTRRMLRRQSTRAEALLWSRLRSALLGRKVRRQYGVGPYVIDFCCTRRKLAIEVGGWSHDEREEYDLERQAYIELFGFRFLRYSNEDVLCSLGAVEEAMSRAIAGNGNCVADGDE